MNVLEYNVTGAERKRLAKAVADICGCSLKYLGTPTFGYQVGNKFLVSRMGSVLPDARVSQDELWKVFWGLLDCGFTPEWDMMTDKARTAFSAQSATVAAGGADGFCMQLPRVGVTDAALENLRKLTDSKAALIRKALGADRLQICEDDRRVLFPWFDATPDPDMTAAALRFVERLMAVAKARKRVNAKEREVENEKYAFRCFLLRLGFIGDEYKADRKTLLRNLSGSSAFKSGHRKGDEHTAKEASFHEVH